MDMGEKFQPIFNKALCKATNAINKEVTDVVQGSKSQRIDRRHLEKRLPAPAMCPQTPLTVGERNTRHDPVPREEHLTVEDWAIKTAVESCVVRRSLKAFNLKQREKLLAAICMTFQETVEGNPQRSTVGCPDDFRD